MFVLFGSIGMMLLKEQLHKRAARRGDGSNENNDMDSTNRANPLNGAHAGHVS